MTTTSLAQALVGSKVVLSEVPVAAEVRRRLTSLGLRTGTVVEVLQRTVGGGRVLAVAGSRVALGRNLARQLHVEEIGDKYP